MSTFIKKDITCKCCGHEYAEDVLASVFIDNSFTDLDTNTHDPIVYRQIIQCPKCGYATSDPFKDVDDNVKAAVNSEEFRSLLQAKSDDEVCDKLKAAEFVAEKRDDHFKVATFYATLIVWRLKETGANEEELSEAYKKVAKLTSEYLDYDQDIDCALRYIDLQRQAKEFDDALETVDFLREYIEKGSFLEKVLDFEAFLIKRKDNSDHKLKEVK